MVIETEIATNLVPVLQGINLVNGYDFDMSQSVYAYADFEQISPDRYPTPLIVFSLGASEVNGPINIIDGEWVGSMRRQLDIVAVSKSPVDSHTLAGNIIQAVKLNALTSRGYYLEPIGVKDEFGGPQNSLRATYVSYLVKYPQNWGSGPVI